MIYLYFTIIQIFFLFQLFKLADAHYILLGRSQRDFSIGGHCSLGSIDLTIKTKILYNYFVDEPKKNEKKNRKMNYETCEFGNLDFRIHSANFFHFF